MKKNAHSLMFFMILILNAYTIPLKSNEFSNKYIFKDSNMKKMISIERKLQSLQAEINNYIVKTEEGSIINMTAELKVDNAFDKILKHLEILQNKSSHLSNLDDARFIEKIQSLKKKIMHFQKLIDANIAKSYAKKQEYYLVQVNSSSNFNQKIKMNGLNWLDDIMAPPNDDCVNATSIGFGTFIGDTTTATNDGSASCGESSAAPDVWFSYTAAADGIIAANTFGSSYETVLSVHTSCPGNTTNQIACNYHCGSQQSCVTFNVTAGNSYLIRVSGFNNAFGAFTLNFVPAGSFSGTVTDSVTTAPLENVEIGIFNSAGHYMAYQNTDASGNYSIYLSPGTYYAVTWNTQKYIDELYDNIYCMQDGCDSTSGTAITVISSSNTPGINFALDPGGSISGTIIDASTSLPLAYINVDILDAAGNNVSWANTDASGNYISASGLPTGIYFAKTRNSSSYIDKVYNIIPCIGSCNPVDLGTPIFIAKGFNTTGINFALDHGGSISGTIIDSATSAPLSGIDVIIYDSKGQNVADGWTNSSGYYITNTGLEAGIYYAKTSNSFSYIDELYNNIPCPWSCNIQTGTPILVAADSDTSGINFALDAGGNISGIVTDSATSIPLNDVDIDIYDGSGNYIASTLTDATGNYATFLGLATGDYFARTWNYQRYVDELYNNIPCQGYCNPTIGTPISVTKGSNKPGINFALDLGGSISGRIINFATSAPIYGIIVQIFNSNGNWMSSAYTDIAGNYITDSGLLTGSYFAKTRNYSCYENKIYDNIPCPMFCDPTTGTPISVILGSNTGNINFALNSSPSLIALKPVINDSSSSTHNWIIEPNEPVDLLGFLYNTCAATATGVTGTLTTIDSIAINNGNATYPDIARYSSLYCSTCYNITAPSANRPSLHWDFTVTDHPTCTGCSPASYSYIYHVGNSFADVPPSYLFYSYIEKLLHSGITSGCASSSYCPSSNVQREQMAKFICSSMQAMSPGSCAISSCNGIFTDVPSSNPFCPYIEALYNNGVIAGCQLSPLMYCPGGNTQRQAMAKFICISMNIAIPGSCIISACNGIFSDVPASNPFCGYIEALYYANITSGCQASPLMYCPITNVSRGQMAKFLVNAFGFTL